MLTRIFTIAKLLNGLVPSVLITKQAGPVRRGATGLFGGAVEVADAVGAGEDNAASGRNAESTRECASAENRFSCVPNVFLQLIPR